MRSFPGNRVGSTSYEAIVREAMGTPGLRAPKRVDLGDALLPTVLVALCGLALFIYFFRLGLPSWRGDEVLYRNAGQALLRGDFAGNVENTPLAQYILGVASELFGSGKLAVRAPTAVAGLLTGVFLALLARRVGGWWAAALAFALWCLLPRPAVIGGVDIEQIKIERYGRLDVYMGLFVAASLFAGWRWAETGRWRWAVGAGAAVGLAAASKAPGVLVLPAILACGIVALRPRRRSLLQAATVAAGSLLVLVLVYLPAAGELPSLLDRMRDAQRLHAALGHPFVFDGTLYTHSPPWANLWWQWKSLGTPATVSVALCLLIAPFVLRRALAVLLIGATLLPFVFFAFVLGYALPHYYYDWQPAMIVTCALALYELSRRAIPYRVVAALALCPLVFAAAGTVRDVASLAPRDYTALERELGDRLGGEVVITNTFDFGFNLPGVPVTFDPAAVPGLAAVVDDTTVSSRRPNPRIANFVRRHRSKLDLHRVDFLRVYLPRSPAEARR